MKQKANKSIIAGIRDALLEQMKHDRRFELAVYGILIAAGVLLIVGTPLVQRNETTMADSVESDSRDNGHISQTLMTEARLEEALTSIRGAGKVDVMLMYTSSIPLQAEETGNAVLFGGADIQANTEKDGILTSQSRGAEEICGVIVIAEGAGDIAVRIDLQNAVKTVLGIDASRIEVFEMKPIE